MSERDRELKKAVLRLNSKAWAISMGLLFGGGLFIATNVLVLKGGDPVGPHLSLLGNYFPGYSVTLVGSLIGFIYGFVLGYILGRLVTVVYQKMVAWV